MSEATDAIISIRPHYADAILSGQKTIELRRRVPKLTSGTTLWIYATRPTGAVVGMATIQDVARGRPATIWKQHRTKVGLDYASFSAYFEGAQEAVAILLEVARRVSPITIDQLREVRDCFHPPQVLTRLTKSEAKVLRQLAKV